jgi:hypothetical protein
MVLALADIAEVVRQRIDVDHVQRRRQAELHHRQQAVAARQQTGLGAKLLEQRERVFDARRALVSERCGDLQAPPLSASRLRCIVDAVNPS